jgi:hypothetical protein
LGVVYLVGVGYDEKEYKVKVLSHVLKTMSVENVSKQKYVKAGKEWTSLASIKG